MSVSVAPYPDLDDRAVFITGGGSGIGAALVEAFALPGRHASPLSISPRTPSDALLSPAFPRGGAPAACYPANLRISAKSKTYVGDRARHRSRSALSACSSTMPAATTGTALEPFHRRLLGRQPGDQSAPASVFRRPGGSAESMRGGRRRPPSSTSPRSPSCSTFTESCRPIPPPRPASSA